MLRKSFAALFCIAGIGAFLAGAYYLVMDTVRNGWLAATLFTAGLTLIVLFLFLSRRD